ncbi:MAG: UbiA family prenyltransferase [Candidatus Bathyarchaeia archaeon]
MSTLASKIVAIVEASRPLLWLFSITSAFCGMFMAVKGLPPIPLLVIVALGVGPCITAAINLFNAVFDVEVDKLSKPNRPLPSGRIGAASVLASSLLLYFFGLVIAFMLGLVPFLLTLIGILLSISYSLPWIRIKAKGGLSNFALALGYTTVCFLGGWSIFRNIQEFPWFILIFVTLQVAGANVVKDFVDYEADKKFEIGTLPVKYGVEKSIVLISPLFVGIFLVIPLFCFLGSLAWRSLPLSLFSLWGFYILYSLKRDFSRKNREKAFLQAFFMSLLTEIALTTAYVLG